MTTDICLITPGHVASTPRLVKSADALSEAGYRVHVVAGAPFAPADVLDSDILSAAKWGYTRINSRTGASVFFRKAIRKFSRRIVESSLPISTGIAARAHHAESSHLARAAARVQARLYIGHCIPGLYAAAAAADLLGCGYGFDIEDYHDAETEEAIADPVERRARSLLQSTLLQACRPLTCAAPLIGRKYSEIYRVEPSTILNVFPLSQAPASPAPPKTIADDNPAIFYWFSQTVGPGRGLEEIIRVMGNMHTPTELHLRGFVTPRYVETLQSVARAAGLKRPIRFLEPGSPNEMARLAATSDMGLSIEQGTPLNKDVCLPNKDFVYLLAGIPQILSSTSAQSALAGDIGDAGILARMDRPAETASRLDTFFSDPSMVARARASAWSLGRKRFNWDTEKEILLRLVDAALPQKL